MLQATATALLSSALLPVKQPPLFSSLSSTNFPRYRFSTSSTTQLDSGLRTDDEDKERFKRKISWWTVAGVAAATAMMATTTAVGLLVRASRTLRLQGYIARKLGDHLTKESGYTFQFTSPEVLWRKKRIRLRDVTLLRTPETASETKSAAVDLKVATIDVRLSLLRWATGKGILEELEASGIRGSVDRTHEGTHATTVPPTPKSSKFVLKKLRLRDALISLRLPEPSLRPVQFGIFDLQCDLLREAWLVYDLLWSRSMVGQFDGSLFTLFRTQDSDSSSPIKEMTFRMDNLKMDVLSTGASPPLCWLSDGSIDIAIKFGFQDKHRKGFHIRKQACVKVDFETALKHVKISEKQFPDPSLSFINNAVASVIVPYVNKHSNHIPLNFGFSIPLSKFNGATDIDQTGFWKDTENSCSSAFNALVSEQSKPHNLTRHVVQLIRDVANY